MQPVTVGGVVVGVVVDVVRAGAVEPVRGDAEPVGGAGREVVQEQELQAQEPGQAFTFAAFVAAGNQPGSCADMKISVTSETSRYRIWVSVACPVSSRGLIVMDGGEVMPSCQDAPPPWLVIVTCSGKQSRSRPNQPAMSR